MYQQHVSTTDDRAQEGKGRVRRCAGGVCTCLVPAWYLPLAAPLKTNNLPPDRLP
ncbi:MAG: hypothetical protein GDA43_26490 [Hormoscilla sp. SP5CHS1]|nr:hypothetical protein [Hormoscilla sp. SP12CHS1]MBC6456269.1 hypothetical protein [Hormoscilla sp. SP5CHS1]